MPALSNKERVKNALWRQPVDRLPTQCNFTPAMAAKLAGFFKIPVQQLSDRLGNHLLRLDLTSPKRVSPNGQIAYDWWGAGWDTHTEGYWLADAPMTEKTDLQNFPWPDPNNPQLLEDAQRILDEDHGQHFAVPNFGFALFERAWSLRGFDPLLMDLVERRSWVEELLDRITEIQFTVAKRFVALGVDGGYFGDDYGAQKGLLFSPELWREMFKPRLARLFGVFREAGLPVIFHSDGDIWNILADLVEIGLTALNPVQPEVLDHARLYREFGQQLAFYGGISTQEVLPYGTTKQVAAATRTCIRNLAAEGTGLLVGPSHRMQSDIPVENIAALLGALPKNSR